MFYIQRRSSDGYISATGMFKAAYPWASSNEEQAERKYHKSIPSAGSAEVAGNVWIAPEHGTGFTWKPPSDDNFLDPLLT